MREFERRRPVTLLGIEVPLTRLEDLILAKLEWSALGDSAIQRRDIEDLLRSGGESVDMDYIEDWVDGLGVRDDWRHLQERLARADGAD